MGSFLGPNRVKTLKLDLKLLHKIVFLVLYGFIKKIIFVGTNSHKLNSDRRGLVSSETSPNLSYIAADKVGGSNNKSAADEATVTPVTAMPPPRVGGTGIGASSDLLDWAKNNLANYSTVKVRTFYLIFLIHFILGWWGAGGIVA